MSKKYSAKRWVKDARGNGADDVELNLRADLYLAARRVVELREPHHPEFDLLRGQAHAPGDNCNCDFCAQERNAEQRLIKVAKRLRKEQKRQRKAA